MIPFQSNASVQSLQLLAKGDVAFLDPKIVPKDPPRPQRFEYTDREAVMTSLQRAEAPSYLKAQTTGDDGELRQIIKDLRFPASSGSSSSTAKGKTSSSTSTPKTKTKRTDKRTTDPYMQNPYLLMVEDHDVPYGRYAPSSFADWRGEGNGAASYSSVGASGGTKQQKKQQEINKAAVDGNSYWSPSLVRKIPSAVGKVV